MAYGVSNGVVTDDVTWPQRCCKAVRSAILSTAWLLVLGYIMLWRSRDRAWNSSSNGKW